MRSPGANVGAIGANDFLRQANACGQPSGNHASSRTDPDNSERHTDICGTSPGRAEDAESWRDSDPGMAH